MRSLHLVNGGCMLAHFKTEYPGLPVIAFEEAMCSGTAALPILGPKFILERCRSLGAAKEDYLRKIVRPLQKLKDYEEYILWFDEDMFCQINLLTLLAYLQQEALPLPQSCRIIDDRYQQKYEEALIQADYQNLFKQVVLEKQTLSFPGLLGKGIERYLALNREENELTAYIREHSQTDRISLMKEMLHQFSCYGLGDIQYLELIDRLRRNQITKQQHLSENNKYLS